MDSTFLQNLRSLAEQLLGLRGQDQALYAYQLVLTGSGQSTGTVAAISGSVPGLASGDMAMLDKVFVPVAINFTTYQSGSAALRPLLLVQATSTDDNQPWFSAPVPIWTIAGDGYNPGLLRSRRRLSPRSKVSWSVENHGAAAVDQTRIILLGFHEPK